MREGRERERQINSNWDIKYMHVRCICKIQVFSCTCTCACVHVLSYIVSTYICIFTFTCAGIVHVNIIQYILQWLQEYHQVVFLWWVTFPSHHWQSTSCWWNHTINHSRQVHLKEGGVNASPWQPEALLTGCGGDVIINEGKSQCSAFSCDIKSDSSHSRQWLRYWYITARLRKY